jgi:acetolactate synthase I/III small subunit
MLSRFASVARATNRGLRALQSSSASALPFRRDIIQDPPEAAPTPLKPYDAASGLVADVQAGRTSIEEATQQRTFALLVDNQAGILAKIVGLISARGFNITSLTVSPTNFHDLSRITVILADMPDSKAQQALKQLSDVVNVWAVVDFTGTDSMQRELLMVKVAMQRNAAKSAAAAQSPSYDTLLASQSHRAAVRDVGELFGAEVVDVGSSHVVFQLTSWSRRIDAFVRMLEPFGVIEVARSGVVAMMRSPVGGGMSERMPKEAASAPDASQLPPG